MGLLSGNIAIFYKKPYIYYIYSKPTEVNIGEVTYGKSKVTQKKVSLSELNNHNISNKRQIR